MIEPDSFAIHVTYTCPLTCAHCCFSSSPLVKDRLEPDLILAAIDQLDAGIHLVAFTGGEPFLFGKKLVEFVRRAHDRGFITRVVTSAFWATTPEIARKRLVELVDAGLNEISISWDDFHEEFVRFDNIRNAVAVARELPELRVGISIVQAATSRWTAARVREELDLGEDQVVCESPLNLTGRAEQELTEAGLRAYRALGPCPYVMTGPTLSAKRKLLACCGVIPDTPRLYLDEHFTPERLNEAVARGKESVLLTWLYLRGPYAIMEWMSERYGVTIPAPESVGGNCQACKHLFENPEIEALIDQALLEKGPEVRGEYHLLKSLGTVDPKNNLTLWMGYAPIVDRPVAAPV
jgi:hypothetical protein